MADLGEFAELMRRAAVDKAAKQVQEDARRMEEVAPLLSELFSAVVKEKTNPGSTPEVTPEVVAPQPITELIQSVEEKATDILAKTDPNELEKRFLALFKRIQDDFQALKKHVEGKSSHSGWGGAGSGEVRILRMDDIVKDKPIDGASLVWDSTLNKFKFSFPSATSEDEMPQSKRVDFVDDDLIYRGEAVIGSSETDSVWRIRKIDIGVDGDISETYANGNANYINKWSERAILSYA